uniref:Uncharacterized protein n=1 Tax=Anguilla anguilla TaxID=7936 RepID=A0A0E9ULF1_ANGAN
MVSRIHDLLNAGGSMFSDFSPLGLVGLLKVVPTYHRLRSMVLSCFLLDILSDPGYPPNQL